MDYSTYHSADVWCATAILWASSMISERAIFDEAAGNSRDVLDRYAEQTSGHKGVGSASRNRCKASRQTNE
ncbi:MAG: hypothetical protein FWD57_06595 [Polyangiaceae bacterium]|nr:hypothetical protein [Polyangiaceae bacterium]